MGLVRDPVYDNLYLPLEHSSPGRRAGRLTYLEIRQFVRLCRISLRGDFIDISERVRPFHSLVE